MRSVFNDYIISVGLSVWVKTRVYYLGSWYIDIDIYYIIKCIFIYSCFLYIILNNFMKIINQSINLFYNLLAKLHYRY